MGNSDVSVDTNSDLYIKDKHFKGTRGLWELLTRKRVDNRLVSEDDLKQYKAILDLTSAHLEGYEPGAPIHISRGAKFKTIIAKLFPHTRRRGIEASLHREWEKYYREKERCGNCTMIPQNLQLLQLPKSYKRLVRKRPRLLRHG
jgi:hypothetical protein